MGCNKLYPQWFGSYSHFKLSNFGRRDTRESGTVTCHVSIPKAARVTATGSSLNLRNGHSRVINLQVRF